MKVVRNDVYHVWANQTQPTARNSSGNRSSRDSAAYSYAACIGRIVQHPRGPGHVYLVTTRQYSVTTARHIRELLSAIPHNETVIRVYDVNTEPIMMVESIMEDITRLQTAAGRARTRRDSILREMAQRQLDVHTLCGWYELRVPDSIPPSAEIHAALTELTGRAQTAYNARTWNVNHSQEDAAAILPDWLRGVSNSMRVRHLTTQYMRLSADSNSVETTLGAVVPLAEIRPLVGTVLRALDSGKVWIPRQEVEVGGYRIIGIDSTGTLTVGCHKFAAEEIRRFAAVLTAAGNETESALNGGAEEYATWYNGHTIDDSERSETESAA